MLLQIGPLLRLGSKCYYGWDFYYAWVQMLLQMGPLLHLGPVITLVPSGGGGWYSTKYNQGRLRPVVQPLTLLYSICDRKCTVSLSYIFYSQMVLPSHTLFKTLYSY